eukprot:TRINITY_DN3311_c0_g1_i2.p1 TRINITY_DN3311_c0_g1~~TRINITY_DN3311_c0_g1_i2.p1  ORF type:complete len:545 (+),score=114.50 TRINITY_DN3311_c0_g1_i2:58-1692(+)
MRYRAWISVVCVLLVCRHVCLASPRHNDNENPDHRNRLATTTIHLNDDVPVSSSDWQKIGFKVTFTQDGVNNITMSLAPTVQEFIMDTKIPTVSGDHDTPVPGLSIKYIISDVDLDKFNLDQIGVELKPPNNNIRLMIHDADTEVKCDWEYKAEVDDLHVEGSATVKMKLDVNEKLQLGEEASEPTAKIVDSEVNIHDFDVDVHGGASWFEGIFVDIFKDKIKKTIEDAMQDQIKDQGNDLAKKLLATLPTVIPIDTIHEIDYGLTQEPNITETTSTTSHKGDVSWYKNDSAPKCPFKPSTELPNYQHDSYPLQVFVSDKVLNCIGFVSYEAGALDFWVTNTSIPSGVPAGLLNTTFYQLLLPALYKQCPACNMAIQMTTRHPPIFDINPKGVDVDVLVDAGVYTEQNTNEGTILMEVFTLSLNVSSFFKGNLTGTNFTGSFFNPTFNATVVNTSIGIFAPEVLDTALRFLVFEGVMPYLNKLVSAGVPLPVIKGISLGPSIIENHDGYFALKSFFDLDPPKEVKRRIEGSVLPVAATLRSRGT